MFKALVLLGVLFPCALSAAEQTGVIHTINANLGLNKAVRYLEGKPVFSESGCSNFWIAKDLDDQKFKNYIWPLLITAKTTNSQIRIVTSGCDGPYPNIVAVDFAPRN